MKTGLVVLALLAMFFATPIAHAAPNNGTGESCPAGETWDSLNKAQCAACGGKWTTASELGCMASGGGLPGCLGGIVQGAAGGGVAGAAILGSIACGTAIIGAMNTCKDVCKSTT